MYFNQGNQFYGLDWDSFGLCISEIPVWMCFSFLQYLQYLIEKVSYQSIFLLFFLSIPHHSDMQSAYHNCRPHVIQGCKVPYTSFYWTAHLLQAQDKQLGTIHKSGKWFNWKVKIGVSGSHSFGSVIVVPILKYCMSKKRQRLLPLKFALFSLRQVLDWKPDYCFSSCAFCFVEKSIETRWSKKIMLNTLPWSPHWIVLQFVPSSHVRPCSGLIVWCCASYFNQQRELQFHGLSPLLSWIEELKTKWRGLGRLTNRSGEREVNLLRANERLCNLWRGSKVPFCIMKMLLLSKFNQRHWDKLLKIPSLRIDILLSAMFKTFSAASLLNAFSWTSVILLPMRKSLTISETKTWTKNVKLLLRPNITSLFGDLEDLTSITWRWKFLLDHISLLYQLYKNSGIINLVISITEMTSPWTCGSCCSCCLSNDFILILSILSSFILWWWKSGNPVEWTILDNRPSVVPQMQITVWPNHIEIPEG